jgi:hypothetical protein
MWLDPRQWNQLSWAKIEGLGEGLRRTLGADAGAGRNEPK